MPGRVLLVDAVATGRIVLKAKLSAAYYDVIEARTRDTALCLAAREQPDLILLDMTSPQLGAVALCRALKSGAETADIPVMMITAAGDGDMAARALRAQADDYIARPLDEATLLVRVGAAIRNKELTRELTLRGDSFRDLGFAEDQRPLARQGRVAVLAATPDQARDLAARVATRSRHRVHALSIGGAPHRGVEASDPPRTLRATAGRAQQATAAHGDRNNGDDHARAQAAPPKHPSDAQSNAPPDASRELPTTASDPTAPTAIPTPTPDVFVLILDAADPQAALARLVELQSRRATRHAAIVLAVPEQAVALPPNLGATDIVPLPLDADDLALRLSILIARTLQAEDLRGSVQRGLQMAATDPLTRLYNRRYAQHHLTQIAQRAAHGGDRFAVMILDIDRLKSVNDSFGHRAGDHVLAEIARRLS
ncbi:diguanylate cyclase domain-containing protein, partial [Brevirhabdus sp.]|uniref:diguanylate cyclase domain-containing protein n=1 Tax=Brevirhabdus sp. TaxID=2004514 RepID=UPI004057CE32